MVHLVLLPGMDGGADLSGAFRRRLSADLAPEVVTYPPSEALGYGALEGRVRARLAQASAPLILLGESFSGPLAIRIAADPPPQLAGLVLVATFATPPAWPWLRLLVASPLFRPPPPRWFVRRYLVGGDADDALVEEVRSAIRAVRPAVLAHRLRQVLAVDVTDALERVSVPILSLEARHDRLLPRRGPLQHPGLTCRPIDGPHMLLQARPEESAAAVCRFIGDALR